MGPNETKSWRGGLVPLLQDNANPPVRVLVVDDDLNIRALMVTYLTRAAFRVDTSNDGAEAWEALNVASYHLLITDHQMPKLTGLELIRKLRSESMTLPVILVSGTIPLEEISRHPELRIVAALPKPFGAVELLDTVQKALNPSERPLFADLSVESEAALPSTESLRDEEPAVASIDERINASHRILVVDDNPTLRQLTIDVLEAANYCVAGVKDGAAGWDALQADSQYDLIITDNQMPRMTGIELIEKLRAARLMPRVIMATGSLPLNEFARRPWLKPDAMLQRPYTNDVLLETVSSILRTDKGREGKTAP